MKKIFVLVVCLVMGLCYVNAQIPNSANSEARYHESVTEECVLAGKTDVYEEVFAAGVSVVVYVEGDGDTDLDLRIYDANGNLIDSDTDNTDKCLCEWTPRWRGKFRIEIKNYGDVRNYYTLYIVQ